MAKTSAADIRAIMREYGLGQTIPIRQIERIESFQPSLTNALVKFTYNKQDWYLLFDDDAHDDSDYVISEIQKIVPEIKGELAANDRSEVRAFGLPFRGHDVYLYKKSPLSKRLDTILAERYPETSRSTWQKYIESGYVSVNSVVETKSKKAVLETDSISIDLPPTLDFSDESLPIIYIDEDVIVVNKPAGVLTHKKGALSDEFTVADFFARYTSWGLGTNRPGIVHRLDRDTSGVMIGARNEQTASYLKKQFENRRVSKTYLAVVDGCPNHDDAVIDVPIGRNPSSPSTFRVDPRGKPAQTSYKVIDKSQSCSLVELSPKTGRTHQIRIHMQHIGCPIVGDKVYGTAADRMYLHAHKLDIKLPCGKEKEFIAPIPDRFYNGFNNQNS